MERGDVARTRAAPYVYDRIDGPGPEEPDADVLEYQIGQARPWTPELGLITEEEADG